MVSSKRTGLLLAVLLVIQVDLTVSQSCAKEDDDSCLKSECCADKSKTCFKKDKHWASCKESCKPGISPDDPPEYQTEWSCDVLGQPGTPVDSHRRRRSKPSGHRRRRSSSRRRRRSKTRRRRRRASSRRRRGKSRRRTRRRRSKPKPEPPRRRRSGGGGGGSPPRRRSSGGGNGKDKDSSGKKLKGEVTMWVEGHQNLIGGECEFGNAPVNSYTDPILPIYLRNGFHCAIGDDQPAWEGGRHCGKCYRVTYDGNGGTNPGKAGSAVVMVSNSGAGSPPPGHLDCIMDSFEAITGARTGKFPIEFEEVTCDLVEKGPVIIDWANEGNAFYCKMMFENIGHWGGLEEVELCIDGGNCKKLNRFAGATWVGCPNNGKKGSKSVWKLTQLSPKDGSKETITCTCNIAWPFPPKSGGRRCQCPTNFKGR